MHGASFDAIPAMNAQVNRFWVMAKIAAEGARLKEDGHAVAGSIHIAKRNDFIYWGDDIIFHFRHRYDGQAHGRGLLRPFRKA